MKLKSIMKNLLGISNFSKDIPDEDSDNTIMIVGSPNVGKSVLFNKLAGLYVTVSNYPGTTIECDYGRVNINNNTYHIIDTPGIYSLLPISEEERIARKMLIDKKPAAVIHVVDAKNLQRMLHLTIQLIETGLPVILALNMMDEAKELGVNINTRLLEKQLGIPVVPTVAVTGKGISELKRRVGEHQEKSDLSIKYGQYIDNGLMKISQCFTTESHFKKEFIALLMLQNDKYIDDFGIKTDTELETVLDDVKFEYFSDCSLIITQKRKDYINSIIEKIYKSHPISGKSMLRYIDNFTLHPIAGPILLLFILYFGLYQIIGVFGAGTLVDFFEGIIFGEYINPFMIKLFDKFLIFPHEHIIARGIITTNLKITASLTFWQQVLYQIHSLFIGENGIITLGLSYGIAIILPIVSLFFLFFSVLEDSGYLPRLAAMLDNLLKKIGLNGRAVIPLVLGLGCDTMATLTTRILETKRERIIATFLLALTIPCSAQLGVILGVLSINPWALTIWVLVILTVFIISGIVLNRLLPGYKPSFYIEIPPLRLPKLSNTLIKTYTRIKWYAVEVIPLFILASVIIWASQLLRIFGIVIKGLTYLVSWIGLPDVTARIFLFGFFRRDYGAAGLYDINNKGLLSLRQLIVSVIVLTLFLPCIAQFLIMKKEHGMKITLLISVLIFITAFIIGGILNQILLLVGMS